MTLNFKCNLSKWTKTFENHCVRPRFVFLRFRIYCLTFSSFCANLSYLLSYRWAIFATSLKITFSSLPSHSMCTAFWLKACHYLTINQWLKFSPKLFQRYAYSSSFGWLQGKKKVRFHSRGRSSRGGLLHVLYYLKKPTMPTHTKIWFFSTKWLIIEAWAHTTNLKTVK